MTALNGGGFVGLTTLLCCGGWMEDGCSVVVVNGGLMSVVFIADERSGQSSNPHLWASN